MLGDEERLRWIFENAGSVIRYRVATEFLPEANEDRVAQLRKELLSCPLVQFWLGNLRPDFDFDSLHGAAQGTYENAMGKLYEFGLRKGMKPFDERTEPFRRWLKEEVRAPYTHYFSCFKRTLVAAFLSMTGYSGDAAVDEWIMKRLDAVYAFAKNGSLDNIYVPQDSFPSYPKAFRNYRLINPELYPDGDLKLPWIHDINAFLHSDRLMQDASLRKKVEAVVSLVLKPEYQRLPRGYGSVRGEQGRYYAMGWSVHLHGYFDADVNVRSLGQYLLSLNLLKRSETAYRHSWFRNSLALLESFKNDDGLVLFPRACLPENRFGYWVAGGKMGLEAERRTQKAITVESTFRYSEITKNANA